MDQVLSWLSPILEAAAGKYGIVVQVITVVGSLRLIMKPLSELAKAVVKITPSDSDNKIVEKVLNSKIYKTFNFGLDWLGSIKLPKAKKD